MALIAVKPSFFHTPPGCLETHKPRSSGFTLVELLVTLAIVAVMASLVLPVAQTAAQRSKEAQLREALREIRTALDAYKHMSDEGRIPRPANSSGYPPSLEILVQGVEDQRSPYKSKIYFLRRLARDPLYPDTSVSASATWLKRAYASEPTDPTEGNDVFDVISLSPDTGLNGVPYRQW
jgi:general secretion pathway protein G